MFRMLYPNIAAVVPYAVKKPHVRKWFDYISEKDDYLMRDHFASPDLKYNRDEFCQYENGLVLW